MNYWNKNESGFITLSNVGGELVVESSNGKNRITANKKSGMPVEIFFKLAKKKMGILNMYKYNQRIKKIEQLAQEAFDNGQEAFGEEFLTKLISLTKEAELYALGYKLFLTNEFYDDFCNKTERKIKLTNIKNYARPIPSKIMQSKKKAICFDDFLIMHTDGKNIVKETEKESIERRKKDPIMFGVCKDIPNKLFFIDEWEDEMCNLTFDEIVDKLELESEDVTINRKIEI